VQGTALAERQVDGQENPLVIAEENRLYEAACISA
jgi:TRAP-type C4-dicarboxylate transport system substrate-binding protein